MQRERFALFKNNFRKASIYFQLFEVVSARHKFTSSKMVFVIDLFNFLVLSLDKAHLILMNLQIFCQYLINSIN